MQVTTAGAVPTVVGDRYRLGELIGRGGMSDVYRADDQQLDRQVAVKLLRGSSGGPAQSSDEVRLLARLQHPNLVRLLDAGTQGEVRYVVMELVEGPTLTRAIGGTPLDAMRAARIGSQIAAALAYIHGLGVVHRDIKPGNILFAEDGSARLTDFGIARLIDATHVTPTGVTVGTAAYLAPEQVRGRQVEAGADVYALGLVLLECLTGRVEYSGGAVEAAVARLHRSPRIPDGLETGWSDLLTALTATDPQDRPSAESAAQRLRELGLEPGPINAGGTPTRAPVGRRGVARSSLPLAGRPRARRAALAAAGAAALVVGAGSATGVLPVGSVDSDRATSSPSVSEAEPSSDPSSEPQSAMPSPSTAPTSRDVRDAGAGGQRGQASPAVGGGASDSSASSSSASDSSASGSSGSSSSGDAGRDTSGADGPPEPEPTGAGVDDGTATGDPDGGSGNDTSGTGTGSSPTPSPSGSASPSPSASSPDGGTTTDDSTGPSAGPDGTGSGGGPGIGTGGSATEASMTA